MNRIYCIIGKMVEITQKIELDISDIIENSEIIKEFSRHSKMTQSDYNQVVDDALYLKNKMDTMTFGQIISIVYDSRSLNNEEISKLKSLLEKRNYFTHEYFKVTNYGDNPSDKFITEEFEAIKLYTRQLKEMYEKLELIKKNQVERLSYLKKSANIK